VAIFDNWDQCFVDLRNICTHHDRLFNRWFQKQPQHLKQAKNPTGPQNTLKVVLECLDHSLASVVENTKTVDQTDRIISLKLYAAVNLAEAGF